MVQTRLGRYWSQEKGGGFKKCGSSKSASGSKRKYPKCVPAAKAARMTESQRRRPLQGKEVKHKVLVVNQQMFQHLLKEKNEHGRFSLRKQDKMPARNKKNFRSTKSGAGMTRAGVAAYRRMNPGSKLKTAVTGKVKPGSKAAKRRKSYCARSAGQMKKFPKAAKDQFKTKTGA